MTDEDPKRTMLAAADKIEQLAARSAGGEWRLGGLLVTRPDVIAHRPDGTTEHVAEARATTAQWIATLSPTVAPALVAWLRPAAQDDPVAPVALLVAQSLLDQRPTS